VPGGASGAWIGQIGLNHLAWWPEPDKVEVGWELGRAWWGQGLASEGGAAALRFGFERCGLSRIISVTVADNVASRRVMDKVGLVYQGVMTISGVDLVWHAAEGIASPPHGCQDYRSRASRRVPDRAGNSHLFRVKGR
jgi:RimJ/RimL family protein N-acetyltransferase